jgi:hypothetical protein
MIKSSSLMVIFRGEVNPALQFTVLNLISGPSTRRMTGQKGERIHLIDEFVSRDSAIRLAEFLHRDLGLKATITEPQKGLGLFYVPKGYTELHMADRVLECKPL